MAHGRVASLRPTTGRVCSHGVPSLASLKASSARRQRTRCCGSLCDLPVPIGRMLSARTHPPRPLSFGLTREEGAHGIPGGHVVRARSLIQSVTGRTTGGFPVTEGVTCLLTSLRETP